MYLIIGLLLGLSVVGFLQQARDASHSQAQALAYKKVKEAESVYPTMQAEWLNRYKHFDTLITADNPQSFPDELHGNWRPGNSPFFSSFTFIDSSGNQIDYSRHNGSPCFKKRSAFKLINYGDGYFIAQKRNSQQERFVYTLTENEYSTDSDDLLKTELVFTNGAPITVEYNRIDYREESELNICST